MDQATLKKHMHYDEITGIFTWIKSTSNKIRPGVVAGSQRKDGYIEIRLNGELMLAHRMVWLYLNGEMPSLKTDHINGIRNDNRLCNLRLATDTENATNVKTHCDNRSGLKGVSYDKRFGKYIARIFHKGKAHWLGHFDSPQDAHAAYVKASAELHRDFGRTA